MSQGPTKIEQSKKVGYVFLPEVSCSEVDNYSGSISFLSCRLCELYYPANPQAQERK
jgi:hypothetical protein